MKVRQVGEFEGKAVREAHLQSETGVSIHILSYGAVVRDWKVPVENESRSVVLGFDRFEPYLGDDAHIGAIVGRVANRISKSRFTIGGESYHLPANVHPHHLHGGPKGIGRKNWNLEVDARANSVLLSMISPHLDMGYPGEARFRALYSLKGSRLRLGLEAQVSEPTPINMVQHHYFNLMGKGDILDHHVRIKADTYTPLSDQLLPTGEIRSVKESFYDLREGRSMRAADGGPQAYDINYVLDSSRQPERDPVALVESPDQKLSLKLWTDQPGLQFYNGYYLNALHSTLSGAPYGRHTGFCLEDQMFPDAMNHPHFPSILVTPERPYRHWCEIDIS